MTKGPFDNIPYIHRPVVDKLLRRGDVFTAAAIIERYGYAEYANKLRSSGHVIADAIADIDTTMYLSSLNGVNSSYMWLGKDAEND